MKSKITGTGKDGEAERFGVISNDGGWGKDAVIMCPFVQHVGTMPPMGTLTTTNATLHRDKKGRLRDHNGKRIHVSYTV